MYELKRIQLKISEIKHNLNLEPGKIELQKQD